ncbi:MAG: YebC/PmpR family DNA-binding transcriptional regulator [Deltaproteobacteria bacterium]|nr:YebC/PmpR family DNA-binding transcriptional regulator [Deltaproteobacteria bacterium]
MSGHNRWAKIKHKKLASDQRKSAGWSKFLKEITIATRAGGGDPDNNARLRAAIDRARSDNMPLDTIARAIKKGSGELEGQAYEEVTYEAYGPGGAALVIELVTDNRNRAVAEVRHLLERHGGKMASPGSVTYLFKKRGTIIFEAGAVDEDKLMEAALDLGAEDLQTEGEVVTVLTEPGAYITVKEGLEQRGFKAAGGEVALLPENTIPLGGHEAESLAKLVGVLEEHDDVQNVYANADLPEEAAAE